MTDLEQRFAQEMRALREEGALFAQNFPEAAHWFDRQPGDDSDPYVERMTEACAFLTTRIREEMDDGALGEQLLEQIVPDLLQPLPSVAVVEFSLRPEAARPVGVAKGTRILSEPCEGIDEPFVYRLHQEVAVDWAFVSRAQFEIDEQGHGHLELSLGWDDFDPAPAWPDHLDIFLLGDSPLVWGIRHALLRRLSGIEARRKGDWKPAPDVHFERFDGICYTSEADLVSPFALARDFLCADERFRFVRLSGLASTGVRLPRTLDLRIRFEGSLPIGWMRSVGPQLFRLHTGVAVNRFLEACEPLTWDHTREQQPLRSRGGSQREILEVERVRGADLVGGGSRAYPRHGSYRHDRESRFFQTRRTSVGPRHQLVIAIGNADHETDLANEVLVVDAHCCDGPLPNQNLPPDGLNQIDTDVAELLQVAAITRPTQIHRPPEGTAPSRLLAFAAGHTNGWLDAERLKDGLRHVLWDFAEAKRSLIESIQALEVEHGLALVGGVAWRQMRVKIRLLDTTCTPETWDRLGVVDAFGSVLWRIVRDMVPIGSKGSLELVVDPAGARIHWGE